MPKEVKQKSGLIVGLNAGHSTFAHPPHLPSRQTVPKKNHDTILAKQRMHANTINRGHPQDPRSQDLEEEGFPLQAHCVCP